MQELNEDKIDQSEFDHWKNDRVTQEVFRLLNLEREEINRNLNDANLLLGPDAQKVIALALGKREGLDLLLQISTDYLEELSDEGKETLRT